MPKRISVAKYLGIEELEKRHRQAKDGIESRQYQIIWLLAQGKKTEEVEEITGYSRIWIYALVKRYNKLGVEGLGDAFSTRRYANGGLCLRRDSNQGKQPVVDDIQQAQLWQALQEKALLWRIMERQKGRTLVN